MCAVKRQIASLRAKLGVQKQILHGETTNPRSTQQVRDEYAAEIVSAETERVSAEQVAADEQDAALQAAVVTQAVLGCIWSSLGQSDVGDAAAAVADRLGKHDGSLPWSAAVEAAVGNEAGAALEALTAGGVVRMGLDASSGNQVLQWAI
jgi:hypothetical protein